MKILFALFFIISWFLMKAQSINPLPNDGQWCFSDNFTHPDDPVSTYYEYIFSIETDTILNGITYKNIATTKTFFKSCCHDGEMIYNDDAEFLGYAGAMRYEGQKVYFYKYDYDALGYDFKMPANCLELPDTTEVLIYDFSLEEGDVFKYDPSTWFDSVKVDKVDSIILDDGNYHKRIQFADFLDAGEWVEGLGDLSEGLLGSYIFFGEGCDWNLLCVHENTGPLYSELYCESACHVNESSAIVLPIFNQDIRIIPNPVFDTFYFGDEKGNALHFNEPVKIKIWDLNGEFIYSYTLYRNEVVDISNIYPGLYIVEILKEENHIYKKLIKI